MGLLKVSVYRGKKGISELQLSHSPAALSVSCDEPNLVSSTGLVPAMVLAEQAGLARLAEEWLTVPGSTGSAGAQVSIRARLDPGGAPRHHRHRRCRVDPHHR